MKREIVKDWTVDYLETKIINKMTAVTIPLDISIDGRHRVLDLSEARAILESAEMISQQTCDCRERMGNCIEPMDGCLSLNAEAREMIDKGDAREVTVEEALVSLERTAEAGLVHMAYTFEGDDGPTVICSCCSCCCHTLSAAVRYGYPDHAFTSELISTQDGKKCVNCGICVERCQFDAREMVDGVLVYHSEKCYGCGLCLVCPEGAIELIKRSDSEDD